MRISTFPSTWKHAIIVPIHKPGKPAYSPISYRPINLLSTLSKVYKRILLKRLKPYLHIIPTHQFRFKTQHSTCHQLQRTSEIIVHGFENKQYTTAVFLDLTQAFDNVWHKGLAIKLKALDLPAYLFKTITSFLSDRTFQIKIDTDLSLRHKIKSGVPQDQSWGLPSLISTATIFSFLPTPNSQCSLMIRQSVHKTAL